MRSPVPGYAHFQLDIVSPSGKKRRGRNVIISIFTSLGLKAWRYPFTEGPEASLEVGLTKRG